MPVLLLSFLVPLFLTSFSIPDYSQQTERSESKKINMLEVLESLEAGIAYTKDKSWGDQKNGEIGSPEFALSAFDNFEFDIDFPDLSFEEFDFAELERKLEDLEKRIEAKMEEMAKRFEAIQNKYEKKL